MRLFHSSIRTAAVTVAGLLALLAVAVPLALAAKTEKVTTKRYVVTGTTEDEIRASLDAKRPGKYDARTDWYVSWSYSSGMRGGRCRVTSSKVHTKLDFVYPSWTAPDEATEELRTKWNTYMRRLRAHENGHARIGRAVATRVHNTVNAASAPTCRALDRALPVLVKPHYRWGNAQDLAYDRRTKHGATQGAVFP